MITLKELEKIIDIKNSEIYLSKKGYGYGCLLGQYETEEIGKENLEVFKIETEYNKLIIYVEEM